MNPVSGEREIKQQLMVVRKNRQRKGLQGDMPEVTPGDMTFPGIFW